MSEGAIYCTCGGNAMGREHTDWCAWVRCGRLVIPHKTPTSAQMREATKRQLDAGLPLGASHNRAEPQAMTQFYLVKVQRMCTSDECDLVPDGPLSSQKTICQVSSSPVWRS